MSEQAPDKRIYTLTEEKPVKAVFKMGIPVTMGMLFMVVYNLVDTYFIGMLDDPYQLAATNLAYPVMIVLVAMAGIVGNGGSSYISRCMGAKEDEKAIHTLTIGFELVVITAVVITAIGMIFLNPLVKVLGAQENTFDYTRDYTAVLLLGSLFSIGNYAIGQLLRSEGSVMYSMVGMIAGTVANIVLDPVFIFALHMEIKGAAIATVLGNALSTFIYLYYYIAKKTLLRPSRHLMKLDGGIIKEIMVVGFPHTLEQFFTTAGVLVCNNLAVGYGELAVAGIGVANKLMTFGQYVYQGMTAGCQPLFGYNYGAKNFKRLKKIILSGMAVSTSMEVVITLFFVILAPWLIGLFSSDAEVVTLGASALRAMSLVLLVASCTNISRNMFNSAGKAMHSFTITLIRQLVLYIPFMFLFDHLWGFSGLIHAQPVAELLCMVFAVALLFRFLGKMERDTTAVN